MYSLLQKFLLLFSILITVSENFEKVLKLISVEKTDNMGFLSLMQHAKIHKITKFFPKRYYKKVFKLSTLALCSRNFQNVKLRLDFCWKLITLLPLQFYVKSNFGKFKRSKNVIFGNFWDSELWILESFGLESCSNWLKSKFRTSKIA